MLLMMTLPGMFLNFSTDNSSIQTIDDEREVITVPKAPKISNGIFTAWWNYSFQFRRVINITNPYTYDLTNYTVSIEFDYTQMVSDGKMNSSLKDIRIVENGIPRNYYVKIDHPSAGIATVWFETNISAGPANLEQDTYLYYGNNSVEQDSSYYLNENPAGVAWWKFEDTPGSATLADSIGNNTGYARNGLGAGNWVAPGKAGLGSYAMQFNNFEYIALDMSFSGESAISAMTVTAWVKVPDRRGDWSILDFDRSEYFTVSVGVEGYIATDDTVEFDTDRGNTGTNPRTNDMLSEISDGDVADGTWHHIACTYDKDVVNDKKIYIDGQLVEERDAYNTGVYIGDNQVRYGFIGDGSEATSLDGGRNGRYYMGTLDEVRYFDQAISDKRVEEIFNYTQDVTTALEDEQGRTAIVNVTAIDLNGNYIPYANISLYNTSISSNPIDSKIANSMGSVVFTTSDYTPVSYNFTVSIESDIINGYSKTVNITTNSIVFSKLYTEINLTCNVTTHIFRIKDVDAATVESGWVIVGNATAGFGEIQNCTINPNGEARFWWINFTPSYIYNYTVYYQDDNFYTNTIILESGQFTDLDGFYIDITVNLTTINFTIYESDSYNPIEGVKLILKANDTSGSNIVDLTTDANGKVQLRWWNSTGINGNYSLETYFWENRVFNMTKHWKGTSYVSDLNFTVIAKEAYELWVIADPGNYQTELISLNPTDSIGAEWGTNVLLRALLNVSLSENAADLGPTYADTMTYTLRKGQTVISSGTMSSEVGNIGRHQGIIDTTQLGSGESYSVDISAVKSGFTPPDDISLQLNVLKNEMELNQSDNDDSELNAYWLESLNMTVKPYGKGSESFIMEDGISVESNGNFEFSIPDLSTDWNLSQIVFDIDNVQHGLNAYMYLTITDPYSDTYTWDTSDADNYYFHSPTATNGTWKDLVIDSNSKASPTNNNSFSFKITGNFTGTVDVTATAEFIREQINVEYTQFNVTESIIIPSDGNGWAIKNITFELSDCYNPNTWALIDPSASIDNITTNEGHVYTLGYAGTGIGNLTIDNITIYPLDNQFLFTVNNNTDLMFDVKIKVEYIQAFYQNDFIEMSNISNGQQNFVNDTYFSISYNNKGWTDQGAKLLISEIWNGTDYVLPSDYMMNITINAQTYNIIDEDVGGGFLLLDNVTGFSKETIFNALIQTISPLNFTMKYSISNFRDITYPILGTVTYQVREAPDVVGSLQYVPNNEYYLATIDTALIDADDYTIRFTAAKNHYNSGTKDLDLLVLERLTTLNDEIELVHQIFKTIYVKQTYNFTFTYLDALYGTNITSLNTQSYSWKKYVSGAVVANGTGTLVVNSENQYILDLNTELMPDGEYSITVIVDKKNYEQKIAIIALTIKLRDIDYDLDAKFTEKKISVISGKILEFSITLEDNIDSSPLIGAIVYITLQGTDYFFTDNNDGTYSISIASNILPDALFATEVVTASIGVTKANYTLAPIELTIEVTMTEIFPGVPLFYFLLIVGAIVAVVSYAIISRVIRQAKIPRFVKKVKSVRDSIKGKKSISDSDIYPSFEEAMIKKLGDRWDFLELSLKDILGIETSKGKKLPKGKEDLKENIGGFK
jgi:hypothetical protein